MATTGDQCPGLMLFPCSTSSWVNKLLLLQMQISLALSPAEPGDCNTSYFLIQSECGFNKVPKRGRKVQT